MWEQGLRLSLLSQTGEASEAKATRVAATVARAVNAAIALEESARSAETA